MAEKKNESASKEPIGILNIGTKLLLKDTMDQYLRTLGNYRTYYASNMAGAVRAIAEQKINILITEIDYQEGSAYRLLKTLNWSPESSDLYVILAIEEDKKEFKALAGEIEVNQTLVKPFAAADLKLQMERYEAWAALPKQPWQLLIREAMLALKEKRFRDAEQNLFDAVKSAPDNPIPSFKTGMYYLDKSEYPIAEKLLRKSIELKPDYVAAMSGLGSLFMKKKEYEKAEEFFRKAQLISPLNPDRLLEMVRLQLLWSMDICKSALRIDSANPMPRYMLGKIMAVEKDYIGCVRELEGTLPSLRDELKLEAQTFVALARKLGGLAK